MALWILTIGRDAILTREEVETVVNSKGLPWNSDENPKKGRKIFRNMNLYSEDLCLEGYMPRYKMYVAERALLEREFSEADSNDNDYVVFTTDPIVFETCRVIIHNKFKDVKQPQDEEYGALVVVTDFNHNTYDEDHICGWFDNYGHLDEWPSTENDITSPIMINLSELL